MIYRITLLFSIVCLLFSCNSGTDSAQQDNASKMKYAELLSVSKKDSFTVVSISDPWHSGKVLHQYILVPKDQSVPRNLPKGDVIRTPLHSTAVFSSVHCGLLDEIGAFNTITGVCDAQYIYMEKVQQALATKSISDFGSSMAPNIEKIMERHPEAILLSPFENSGSYGKLGKVGITLIECADYMETSPLGRAEWIKFYGLLTGKEHTADSIFSVVEANYNSIKARVAKEKTRPTVVTEMKSGNTWYIAGNRSTVGRLIADAGGKYIFSDVNTSGSQPFSPEKAFMRAQKADIWLIKYNYATDMTKQALADEWTSNKYMKAFTLGNVYGCNMAYARLFEETPFHPDIMLAEYANIFHPGLLKDYNNGGTKYYKRISK